MARGGKREGAGRKAGALTKRTREVAEKATADGQTPLDYMLAIMRDETALPARRDDMAKAAAPYVHPKLAAVTVAGDEDKPLTHVHRIELVALTPNGDSKG